MKATYWQFRWAALIFLFYLVFSRLAETLDEDVIHFWFWLGNGWDQALRALGYLGLIAMAAGLVRRFLCLSWGQSFSFLGFKKPDPIQAAIGLLAVVPFGVFVWLGSKYGLVTFRGLSFPQLVWFLSTAGFFEEAFFRGFFFRLLRPGRSFFQAAALSGVLWAASHVVIIDNGDGVVPSPMWGGMIFALAFSIPGAYLFERGGNVIWGFLIAHAGFDWLSCSMAVKDGTWAGFWPVKLAGVLSVAIIPWALARRFLPPAPLEKPDAPGVSPQPVLSPNRESARLARYLVPATLAMAALLFACPKINGWWARLGIPRYQRMVAEHPDGYAGYEGLGHEYFLSGQYSQAVPILQKAIKLNPKASLSYFYWGECLTWSNRYGEAVQKYRTAVEISPDSYKVYYVWGYTLEKMGKNDEALEKFEKVVQLPNTEGPFRNSAKAEIESLKNAGR